jgi:signal transduction histidine kinase
MLYVVALGVLCSAVSLIALERALLLTDAQRHERAREAVSVELQRLAQLPPSAESLRRPPATTYIGLHGGWLDETPDLSAVPEKWRATVEETARASRRTHAREVHEQPLGPNTLVVAAAPSDGGTTWAAVLLPPSAYLRPWRWIVIVLAVAVALLVASALRVAWLFKNSVAAEERLQRELAQKDRLAALGRVAAGVAHEVRNPLASIKLRLDLTAASQPLTDEAKQSIVAASGEIARLDRLVSDLLLVAGKQPGPRAPVEMGALARSRAEALGPWAREREVAIVVGGRGGAVADAESVARALDNVLRNAVEASPPRSTVEVQVNAEAGAVQVNVEDRGAGVEAARAGELFEPFFTTKTDGTGLGLAISRAIARAHGGELTYARVGEVTRFQLSLPSERRA